MQLFIIASSFVFTFPPILWYIKHKHTHIHTQDELLSIVSPELVAASFRELARSRGLLLFGGPKSKTMQPIILLSRFAKKKNKMLCLKNEKLIHAKSQSRWTLERDGRTSEIVRARAREWDAKRTCSGPLGREELRVWRGAESARGKEKRKSIAVSCRFVRVFLLRFLRECAIHAHTHNSHKCARTSSRMFETVSHTKFTRVEIGSTLFPRPFVKVALFNSSSFH